MKKEKRVIGWREIVSLPELGIDEVKAKVDTGARTSALHASKLVFSKRAGKDYVEFIIHPKQRSTKPEIKVKTKVLAFRKIKSSTGHSALRPVIETDVIIGGIKTKLELTLVNRDEMGFRMLLGREAMRGQFIVDPGASYVETEKKKTRYSKQR